MKQNYYYMSFVKDDIFVGTVVTTAPTAELAVLSTHLNGINPGGEVLIIGFDEDCIFARSEHLHNRLLSKIDLETIDKVSRLGELNPDQLSALGFEI